MHVTSDHNGFLLHDSKCNSIVKATASCLMQFNPPIRVDDKMITAFSTGTPMRVFTATQIWEVVQQVEPVVCKMKQREPSLNSWLIEPTFDDVCEAVINELRGR